ncbi:MAG: hypothetical protein ROO71_04385 [Balneola sp.]
MRKLIRWYILFFLLISTQSVLGQKYQAILDLEVGKTYSLKIEDKHSINLEYEANLNKSDLIFNYDLHFKVINNKENEYITEVHFSNFSYKESNTLFQSSTDIKSPLFGLVNKKFTVILSKYGGINNIEGLQHIVNSLNRTQSLNEDWYDEYLSDRILLEILFSTYHRIQ